MSALNESHVEDAALEWFGEQGCAVGHRPHLAPGEYAGGTLTPALCLRPSPLRSGSHGERESYGAVVLVGRLREVIRRLNPANACGNPHPASPTGRGEEARATIKRYLTARLERRLNS